VVEGPRKPASGERPLQSAHVADQSKQLTVLFTAFEPSGDAHAAPVIAELKRLAPALRIVACGGPLMEQAGAAMIDHTADDGAMGLNAMKRYFTLRRQIASLRRWATQYRVVAHVAVDSPAANFPICRIMKRSGARVIHLVAPQLWAWGRWRVGKLRRLTDLVICLLPFEEQWFSERGIPAQFVGHPVMSREIDRDALREAIGGLPAGSPRVAIFPGSRSQEVRANIGTFATVFDELRSRHSAMSGLIVAANPRLAGIVRSRLGVFPTGLHLTTGQVEPAIAWCDLALAVSGTISLDITRHHKPMVAVYRTSVISWLGSKALLRTRYRLLPNIVAGREICPEFIPHVGGAGPIVRATAKLLEDSKNAAKQTEALRRVSMRFANKRPGEEAARLIARVIARGSVE
jgi:lipid-A-disaccharide synthase